MEKLRNKNKSTKNRTADSASFAYDDFPSWPESRDCRENGAAHTFPRTWDMRFSPRQKAWRACSSKRTGNWRIAREVEKFNIIRFSTVGNTGCYGGRRRKKKGEKGYERISIYKRRDSSPSFSPEYRLSFWHIRGCSSSRMCVCVCMERRTTVSNFDSLSAFTLRGYRILRRPRAMPSRLCACNHTCAVTHPNLLHRREGAHRRPERADPRLRIRALAPSKLVSEDEQDRRAIQKARGINCLRIMCFD